MRLSLRVNCQPPPCLLFYQLVGVSFKVFDGGSRGRDTGLTKIVLEESAEGPEEWACARSGLK